MPTVLLVEDDVVQAETYQAFLSNEPLRYELNEKIDEYQHLHRCEYHKIVGASQPMQTIYQLIDKIAPTQASILITGETGTGKELCAQAIHKQSPRKDKPFITINCGAFPKDLIESQLFGHVKGAFTGAINKRDGMAKTANGGTLFLDEIGEMPLELQSRLLRLVQSGQFHPLGSDKGEQVDIHFICATNHDLKADILAGQFREDLYHRLNVFEIKMPALRTRGEDILQLARHFLNRYALSENKPFQGFTEQAELKLLSCDWPGNVRKLEHTIYQVVVLNNAPLVTAEMLLPILDEMANPSLTRPDKSEESHAKYVQLFFKPEAIPTLEEIEKQAIIQIMELTNNNVTKTARHLKIDPTRIYRKYKKWGLKIR